MAIVFGDLIERPVFGEQINIDTALDSANNDQWRPLSKAGLGLEQLPVICHWFGIDEFVGFKVGIAVPPVTSRKF